MPLAQEFSLLPTVSAGRVVVAVRGDLDVGTVPALRGALAELIDGHGACSVVIDMEGLTFIDSAGIHALVEALKRLRRGGGDPDSHRRQPWRLQGSRRLRADRRVLSPFGPPVHDGDALSALRPLACDWSEKDWRELAACRDVDPELFFPLGRTGLALVCGSRRRRRCAADARWRRPVWSSR